MGYNALNQYKQNTVLSATPEELTLMLLDGAIKFINIGKYSIGKNDISKADIAVEKVEKVSRYCMGVKCLFEYGLRNFK